MKTMPIQRRGTPTYEGVERQIQAFERLYNLDTSSFMSDCHNTTVDEDDAVQWSYLVDQREVLIDAAVGMLYGRDETAELKNCDDMQELLAA